MSGETSIKVWDPLVRTFHWLVVVSVFLNLFILEDGKEWHQYLGYAVVCLVALRFIWGFIGTKFARFSNFWPSAAQVKSHAKALLHGHVQTFHGHSPLGACMMIALCGTLLSLGFTGWLMGTDMFWGAEWVEEVHETFSGLLELLVVFHVLAAVLLSKVEGVNLVAAMIHGRKNIKN